MHLETFTQPCAERSKSLVEQTDEIKVESLLESNDIQPLGNKLRFLVAPRKREYHESDALFFLTHPRWRSMRRHTLPTDIANSSYFYDLCKPKLIK